VIWLQRDFCSQQNCHGSEATSRLSSVNDKYAELYAMTW